MIITSAPTHVSHIIISSHHLIIHDHHISLTHVSHIIISSHHLIIHDHHISLTHVSHIIISSHHRIIHDHHISRAVLGASRKGCGAPGRRWAAARVCVAGAPQPCLRGRVQVVRLPRRQEPRPSGDHARHTGAAAAATRRAATLSGGSKYSRAERSRPAATRAAAAVCVAGAVLRASRKGLAACCV